MTPIQETLDNSLSGIGKRMKDLRQQEGLTKGELASELAIKEIDYVAFEQDQAKMPAPVAFALAQLFGVNIKWLVTGMGSKHIARTADLSQTVASQTLRTLSARAFELPNKS